MNPTQAALKNATKILDTVQEAYLCLDAELRFTFINRAAEILLGAARPDLIGKTPWEVHPETAGTPLEEGFRRAKAENATVSFENYYEPWKRWYTITAMPDSQGGFVVHFLDSTEHKRAQLALQESENRYRFLFEHMQEGVAYCRMIFENGEPKDFVYLMVNETFETLTHLTGVVGKRVTEVIPGIREYDPELLQIYGRVALTGQPHEFEMYVKALSQRFSISVYSPEQEYFVAVFDVITERKQTEARLVEQNERFRRIIENTDAGYFRIGMDGCYEDVNPAWLRMYGFTRREDAIGQHFSTVQVPEDVAKAETIVEALMRGESVRSGEFSRLRRDGTIGYHSFSANPVLDGDRVIGIEGFLLDISDRKTTEEQYKLIAENAADVIWLWDLEKDRAVYVSPSVHKLRGFSSEEVKAQPLDQTMLPDSYQIIVKETKERIAAVESGDETARIRTNEVEYICKDGSSMAAERVTTLLSGDQGKVRHVLGVSRDITERKRMEDALRKSEERFSRAFQTSPAAITIADLATGTYLEVNVVFEQITGYRRDEVIGRRWDELGLWTDLSNRDEAVRRLLAGESVRNWEFGFRKKMERLLLVCFQPS